MKPDLTMKKGKLARPRCRASVGHASPENVTARSNATHSGTLYSIPSHG